MVDGANGESAAAESEPTPHPRRHGGIHLSSRDDVTVITEARPSYDDAFRARRTRYVIMMAMRLPCLILAVVFYQTPWLALLIILASIPLPWMAVLIANDGPARKRIKKARPAVNDQRALAPGRADVIDDDGGR